MRLDPADARQVDDVAAAARRTLGDDLGAAYLYGSATGRGLRPDSDLDVLAVVRAPLAGHAGPARTRSWQCPALRGGPWSSRCCGWTRSGRGAGPRRELQYGEWLRTQLATGDASPLRPRGDPDVAVLITRARDAETHDPWNDHRDDVRRLADLLGVGQ